VTLSSSDPLLAGEDGAAGHIGKTDVISPTEPHPTAEQIDRLFVLAESCREVKDLLGRRLREIMGLPGETRISKKFLVATMTTTQYDVALSYYEQMLKRQVEEDVPSHEPALEAGEPDASTAVAETPTERPAAVPSNGSLSAPGPAADADAAERDRQRLRQEIASWDLRVKPGEIEHVILHHPYSKARQLLWDARRQPEPALAS
jgi:hypothetical protein